MSSFYICCLSHSLYLCRATSKSSILYARILQTRIIVDILTISHQRQRAYFISLYTQTKCIYFLYAWCFIHIQINWILPSLRNTITHPCGVCKRRAFLHALILYAHILYIYEHNLNSHLQCTQRVQSARIFFSKSTDKGFVHFALAWFKPLLWHNS